MVQLTPAPGKLPADGKEIIPTDLLQDDAITTAKIVDAAVTAAKQSAAGKIKRASSNVVSLIGADAAVALMYTSTAITITAVRIYRITATVGDNCTVDVGINSNDDAIVEAAAVAAGNIDTIVSCTIALATVAAGKMVTASIHHVAGTSGTAVVAIEYYENA
jgi:hypothetical protein